MDASWYVIHSKPRKETRLYMHLCANDIEVFYPSIKAKPVNPRASKIQPYFPGYLFVYVDLERVGKNTLDWMPGATGLVSFGGEPSIVPEKFVHELKQHLAQLEAERDVGVRNMKPGEKVQITGGTFAGYEAIFDRHLNSDQRAQVLLQWFGQPLKVEVNASLMEKKSHWMI